MVREENNGDIREKTTVSRKKEKKRSENVTSLKQREREREREGRKALNPDEFGAIG